MSWLEKDDSPVRPLPRHRFIQRLHSFSSYPYIEVSIIISGADAEGVVGPRRDAGGLDLEDVRGHGALRGDAHVAVHDGERQISAGGLVDRTHATAVDTHTHTHEPQ